MSHLGATFDAAIDGPRLTSQLEKVREFMADGEWHTLAEIAWAAHGSEAGVSARLRQLRAMGRLIEKRRRGHRSGLWEYRIVAREISQ